MELEKQREGNWRVRTRDYIEDVQSEMKRVSWPTWPQVRSTTIVVIISTFLLSGYFFEPLHLQAYGRLGAGYLVGRSGKAVEVYCQHKCS